MGVQSGTDSTRGVTQRLWIQVHTSFSCTRTLLLQSHDLLCCSVILSFHWKMVLYTPISADLYSGYCKVETLHLRVKIEKQSALKPHIYGTFPTSQALGTDFGTWGNSAEKIHDREEAMDNTDEHRCLIIAFPLLTDYGPFPEPKITWVLSGFQTCKSFKHKCLSLIPSQQTGCWLFYEEMQHHQTQMLFFVLPAFASESRATLQESAFRRAAWTHYSEPSFALFKTLSWPGLHSCQCLCTIRTRKHVRIRLKNITDTLV